MLKKLTALLLANIIMFTLLIPVGSAELICLPKGDANLDGRVTVEDARKVLRISMKLEVSPTKGTVAFNRLKLSAEKKNKLTSADARLILRASIGLDDYNLYYSKKELTDLFNMTANRIKSDSFRTTTKMSAYTVTETADTGKYSTGSNNCIFSFYEDIAISNDSYPLFGYDYVSVLTSDDIKSISIDISGNKNMLSDYGDNKREIPWDGDSSNCVIIHMETVEGILSEINEKKPDFISSYKKAFNFDIPPEYNSEYGNSEILTEEPQLQYNEITVNVAVDYICKYSSDFSSLVPVAAEYKINTVSEYSLSYNISIPGRTAEMQTETGTATEEKTILYIFNRYIQ